MPLEDLLGLGGGDSLAPSVSPRDAQSLALIQAMQQTQQAGLQRTASPIGSIAQALIPLFAAPIAAKQAQQKAMLQDLLIKLKLADVQATLAKAKKDEQPKNLEELLTQRAVAGKPTADIVALKQSLLAPKQETVASTELSGIRQDLNSKLGRDPSASEMNAAIQQQKQAVAGAGSNVILNREKAFEDYKQETKKSEKKPLPTPLMDNFVKHVSGLDTLDEVLGEIKGGGVTRGGALKTELTGGLLSNPTFAKYATYYNDVAQGRFKSRVTQAELTRLSKELPPPMSYVLNPEQFVKRLDVARGHAANILGKEHDYARGTFEIPPEITQDVDRVRSGKNTDSAVPMRDGWKIEVSP